MILDLQNISPGKIYSRIVSLVPSQTELLHDLGLEQEVVGITKFCVHPGEWFSNKIKIGGTKTVKISAVQALKPDLIIANKEENIKEQVEELALNNDVLVTDVNNLDDALNMIHTIGRLTGKSTEASQMVKTIEMNFRKLKSQQTGNRKAKTAYLIWKGPLMAAGGGTFINDMMAYCGFQNIFSLEDRYPEVTLEHLAIECELILLSSEPYPFKEKHRREIALQLPKATIILVDGEMFSWYGSRLILAAGYFKDLMPELSV
jgi:ABC-type Fe3+-hydroxamate transport system substrate-binding protein